MNESNSVSDWFFLSRRHGRSLNCPLRSWIISFETPQLGAVFHMWNFNRVTSISVLPFHNINFFGLKITLDSIDSLFLWNSNYAHGQLSVGIVIGQHIRFPVRIYHYLSDLSSSFLIRTGSSIPLTVGSAWNHLPHKYTTKRVPARDHVCLPDAWRSTCSWLSFLGLPYSLFLFLYYLLSSRFILLPTVDRGRVYCRWNFQEFMAICDFCFSETCEWKIRAIQWILDWNSWIVCESGKYKFWILPPSLH